MAQERKETYDNKGNVIKVELIEYDDAPILRMQSQQALDKSDITVARCAENNIAVPAEWAAYRVALRAIVKNGSGDIPNPPNYPKGT